ncbi:PAS-domain containing protein [Sulfitobacter donghicola]|uniref:PAS-domain containing protein n=1 Tax=Sulfitobacter donghicola TaxID=421000 RepID=UPI0012DD3D0C|nr:PAS-domain containing protein [Sulfitobacter donghicola]
MILFTNGTIEDASASVMEYLPIALGAHNWEDLYEILLPNFPDFPLHPLPAGSDEMKLASPNELCRQLGALRITWLDNGAVLTFVNNKYTAEDHVVHEELEMLRQVNSILPYPVWKTDRDGRINWYNDAYKNLAERLSKDIETPVFSTLGQSAEGEGLRQKVLVPYQAQPEWFDVVGETYKTGTLWYATSQTALINAENAQQDFVQTLAKTFAHLSIGLAVFNKDRRLALFNPALIDLTGLSASFLSPRPTIGSFFDAMRENRRMPEPKSYNTWRQRMAEVISAAELGKFEETWTLETGQTYSVKGRPHPDGAIAFLFEDISAEVSVTRNFRAELELGQSLVDTIEDALAVFSQTGSLTFSNKAYDVLWGFQFDSSFAEVTIADAIAMWKEKSSPNPLWQELQDSVMSLEDRMEWEMPVRITGQHPMKCRIVPIASGATVIRFSRHQNAEPEKTSLANQG